MSTRTPEGERERRHRRPHEHQATPLTDSERHRGLGRELGRELQRRSRRSGPGTADTEHPAHTANSRAAGCGAAGPGQTGAALQGLSSAARAHLPSQTRGSRSARGARVPTEERQPHKAPLLPKGGRRGRLRRPWEKTPPPQQSEGRTGRHAGSGEERGTGLARSPGGRSKDGGEVAKAGQAGRAGTWRADRCQEHQALTRRRWVGGQRGTGKGLLAQRALPGAWPQGWQRGPAWQGRQVWRCPG